MREFRIDEISDDITVGSKISADAFTVGDTVHATGTSKGKGFAGTIILNVGVKPTVDKVIVAQDL